MNSPSVANATISTSEKSNIYCPSYWALSLDFGEVAPFPAAYLWNFPFPFHWQKGYEAFSYSCAHIDRVYYYILSLFGG